MIEHIRFIFWKQVILPIKANLNNCDILFCTDYFVPYFTPGFKAIPVFYDAFFFEYSSHYNAQWLKLFKVFGVNAAKNYNLKIINEDIGDNQAAVTRFVVVEKPGRQVGATGKDRTSLAVFIAIDHAGALLEILNEFAKHQVNLTFIQSRPTGSQLGHYHFIIDAEGHIEDKPISAALAGLKQICEDIRFLGSYPQAK